ncbi:MAG: DNA methyltransferase [Streptosporangiaceae bacterium]
MGALMLRTDSPPTGASPPPALDFGPAGHLYATHPLHAFAARCPPPLAAWAIDTYTKTGATVLDPMAGSGTTLVEATLLGRRGWGADIDPLARLIAKAKATPVDPAAWGTVAARAETLAAAPDADDGWRPPLPDLDKWFRADVAADLARLRTAIARCDADPGVRDLLWVCFSSLVVARTSVANARDLVHSRHHYRPWKANPDVLARFSAKTRQVGRMLDDFRGRLQSADEPDVRVVGDDARALPVSKASVDLVFTSPPYCSALDYTRAHIFAVAWMPEILGVTAEAYRRLGRAYVGSERAPLDTAGPRALPPPTGDEGVDRIVRDLASDRKRAWIVHRYFRDMRAVLGECARVVKPQGRAVLVVCPSNIRKVRVPTHTVLARMATSAGRFAVEELHERTINDNRRVMPYLEASFGPRMRTEYVIVLRRNETDG